MTGEAFKDYLRSQLGPTLKPGNNVICEHLPAHKVAEVQAIIAAHGATIQYRPPVSPDLNPIKPSKEAERTDDKLWQRMGKLLDQFQADECLNLFRHSGYVST